MGTKTSVEIFGVIGLRAGGGAATGAAFWGLGAVGGGMTGASWLEFKRRSHENYCNL